MDPTEDPNFHLPQHVRFADAWEGIRPYLFHPSINNVISLVISTQDSVPLWLKNVLNLPNCTTLQLRTHHPIDLSKFFLPKLTLLALLACDSQDVTFMDEEVLEVIKTARAWTTKPRNLFLGLQTTVFKWKMLLSILGGGAVSVQIAVRRNCQEGEKLLSFLEPGNEERKSILPFVENIRCYVIEPMGYSSLAPEC